MGGAEAGVLHDPGLENAEFVRYGVMHRNTFLDAPRVLSDQLCLKSHPNVFFAGQSQPVLKAIWRAQPPACWQPAASMPAAGPDTAPAPADTMCGALMQYLVTENKNFQPMGANMDMLPLPRRAAPG